MKLSTEEYRVLKEKEMNHAEAIVANIQNSNDPLVMYRDIRPVTDLKHMIETSASDEWYGDHVAFYEKEVKGGEYKTTTYKEALADMNALGTALIAEGMKDRRIAIIGENCYRWAISYLAAVCGTGIAVPLDKELNAATLESLLIQADVGCVIFTKKYENIFKEIKEKGGTSLDLLVNMNAEEEKDGVKVWKDLVARGKEMISGGNREFLDAQIYRDEMSVLLFTSGTTGASKGVMLSHGNIVEDLMASPTVLQVNDWDIFFSVLPIHHTYECTCGFLMPLYRGAAIAYCEGLKYIVRNLSEVRPTMFLGVPVLFENLYKKIWQNVRKKGKEKSLRRIIAVNNKTKKIGIDLGKIFFRDILAVFGGRMRMMIAGGAAINPEVLEGIQDFGIQALQGYGLTECAPMGALNPDIRPKSSSVGRAFPGFDVRIEDVNDEGIGEICLKGGNVMLGYYNMPEETANAIKDGWFYSGDLGYLDDEGYLFITGRKKNVIITKNGKNVYPEELEYLLNNVPLIEESMVFGEDTADGKDTLIVASVRLDKEAVEEKFGRGMQDDELEKIIWEEVDKINTDQPFFKKIKKVIIRKEEFEKNTAKKIKRFVEDNKK